MYHERKNVEEHLTGAGMAFNLMFFLPIFLTNLVGVFKEYYLSVSEDFEEGSIMKKNDTHTLYTIPSGPKILEILEQTH